MNINTVRGCVAPTLAVVKEFYSKNGVPIDEDKTLDFSEINELRVATADERYNFLEGYTSARINFDRENRFYADIGFDGGKWIMEYHPSRSDIDTYVLQAKKGQLGAGQVQGATSSTGYFTKKFVHWESGFGNTTTGVVEYAWPEIRLAEVYLMYAEALNEAEGPVSEVHYYLNEIRKRAGLGTVEDSWTKYSKNPTKPDTKEGMREIIRRERPDALLPTLGGQTALNLAISLHDGKILEKYGVQVYLEPGEAWALNAGYLVTTVLDTLQNGDTSLAILDMSAACHTPDVIEMPYRPPLLDAGEPGEKPCTVRLGGPTCLAGDVMGDYSFKAPLAPGQRLVFGDMAIYTTCKNNTFNGMPLPDIWLLRQDGSLARLAHFGYQDFRCRLGGRGDGALDTTSVQI